MLLARPPGTTARSIYSSVIRHQKCRILFCYHNTQSTPCRKHIHTCVPRSSAVLATAADNIHLEVESAHSSHLTKIEKLPAHCSGCGAPSQTVSPKEAGYYTLTRQGLRSFFRAPDRESPVTTGATEESPICDRCHNLLHHSAGAPIFHPSIQSIQDMIDDSPHPHNHIYHVLDAADLPMSLIPSLQQDLRLPRLRSQNRRSKQITHSRGRVAEVSFIITRADLLAPKKEQVDTLMPYIREVLRDALGQTGKNVRLGNLRCVSAKRGWWTKHVKEDIWQRGGAGWMVGKVNVGKSSLFEVVFPKGRGPDIKSIRAAEQRTMEEQVSTTQSSDALSGLEIAAAQGDALNEAAQQTAKSVLGKDTFDDENASLLPPARLEVAYPAMPISSALPGTTASPIRVPYGNGRGELIDLPGVARSSLEAFVKPDFREDLVMRSRVAAEQYTVKPGQSLLLGGGLVRITPTTPDVVLLAYPFVPLGVHVTSNEKADAMQSGERATGVESLLTEDARARMKRAAPVSLKWDVTRQRAGPLTSKVAVKLKPAQLPFTVWSADVVIEGVGWVELVAQTRKKRANTLNENPFPETMSEKETAKLKRPPYPQVEVMSPDGKFVAARQPMNAWLLGGRQKSKTASGARPRRSIKSAKQSDEGRARSKAG